MNKTSNMSMKPRKRIALTELQILVSLLVKFWRNKHGDCFSDIWKPTWWPSNIRFTYPIKRNKNISPAQWRKDLITVITNYYHTTKNQPEHLNGRNVLNNSDFLWEIQRQMFHNNNNNNNNNDAAAALIKPNRSNRENNIQLSENTLKRLMPRLEVRLVDILATDQYRKFRQNLQHSEQKVFLRNLSLITIPEYDNMNVDARYTFRASTKVQSDGQPSSPRLQEAEEETISTLEKQNQEQLVLGTNEQETNNNEQQIAVEEEIVLLNDVVEPIVVVDTPAEEVCLQETQVDVTSCEENQSFQETVCLVEKTEVNDHCSPSSSKVSIDIDELSLKARLCLEQCTPSYVKLDKCKASNERRSRKKLKKRRKQQRILQPRTARIMCRLKIYSSYVRKWKNTGVK